MGNIKKVSLKGYLTQKEAADILEVERQRVFTLCKDGQLDVLEIGSTRYPSRASVEAYKKNEKRKHRPKSSMKSPT